LGNRHSRLTTDNCSFWVKLRQYLSVDKKGKPAMNDKPESASTAIPPDRLDVKPKSRFHDAAVLARGVGIRFNGVERKDVEEYCVSEGWIRVAYGKAMDRRGNPMTLKLQGVVEPFFLLTQG
jgi:Protein of unknown function (DUF3297)